VGYDLGEDFMGQHPSGETDRKHEKSQSRMTDKASKIRSGTSCTLWASVNYELEVV